MRLVASIRTEVGIARKWLFKSNARVIGVVIILTMIFVGVFADQLSPYPLTERFGAFRTPSAEHLLGTDDVGRDIFSELIQGTRISLEIGFIAATVSLVIGVALGVIAGYYRGYTEHLILGLTDLVIVIPSLPLLMIMVAYFSRGVLSMAIAISIIGWCGMVRVIHPRVLGMRDQPFIESAKALGKSNLYIITKHIIPNCREVISTKYSLAVGGAIMAESSMAFLGLGDPLNLSWGGIINEAYTHGALVLDLWWWYTVPALLISLVIIAFMLIGHSKDEDKWVG